MSYDVERPSIVTAAAVIMIVMGVLAGLGGLAALAVAGDTVRSGLVTLMGLVLLACAVLYIVLATKILHGSNGARVTTLVLMWLGIALDVIRFDSRSVISILLALLVIGMLSWNRDAKDYFGV